MVQYEAEIVKRINKGLIPKEVFVHFNNNEDIVDRETITRYEKRETKSSVSFIPADEVLKITH